MDIKPPKRPLTDDGSFGELQAQFTELFWKMAEAAKEAGWPEVYIAEAFDDFEDLALQYKRDFASHPGRYDQVIPTKANRN